MKFREILFCLLATITYLVTAEDLYDSNSPVNLLNRMNFAKRITNNRKKGISIVHFYSADSGDSSNIKEEYEDFTKKNKGMYNLCAINCDTNPDICEKEGVTKYPNIRIYPQHPIPSIDLPEERYSLKKLRTQASKFLENRVIEITSANHDTFIKDNPGKPKAFLFTESKDVPVLYKALSYNFDKTLFFGIVRSSESSLVKKYKIKDFPKIILAKPGEKPRAFDGEINYYNIANFINVYSEIFDFGDASNQQAESAASKPWMSAKLPELTADSSKDICFSKKGLWVILFSKEQPSDTMVDTMTTVRESFVSNLDNRGLQFSFMWIDANIQQDWVTTFGIENFPQAIVLNPGKKKKFMEHKEELVTESSLSSVLNSIIGGNGRFKRVEGNKLPELKNKE